MPLHLYPSFLFPRKPNGDYRNSPISKDRSRSPIERVVVASGLGVHSNHLYSHAHHHHHMASLAVMDQPLALTKSSMDSARSSTAAMTTVPHTVSAVERQQVTYTLFCHFCGLANRKRGPGLYATLGDYVPAPQTFRSLRKPQTIRGSQMWPEAF